MRFRIPPQHRETVTIVRRSAYEATEEETIADGVVCMIQPLTSGIPQREATQYRENIPIQQTEKVVLLSKPNPAIVKGDFLRRSDGCEFRILDVLHMKGSPIMRLYIRDVGVL